MRHIHTITRWTSVLLFSSLVVLAQEEHAIAPKTAENVVTPEFQMVIWTWVVFVLLALVLFKFGFKPILQALDAREQTIRDGLESAEAARQELADIEARRAELIHEAETQAKSIVEASRQAAQDAAKVIEDRARHEAQILTENARREISAATEAARAGLRRESGELAIKLAARILNDNLDEARNKALVDKLIDEI